MAVSVNDVVRVTAQAIYDDSDISQNVYHLQHQGTAGISDLVFLQETVTYLEGCYGFYVGNITQDLVFDQIIAFNVTQDRPMGSYPFVTLAAGLGTADALPLQASALVSFPSGVSKRIGKKFLAGLMEADSDNGGELSAALQTALVNYAAAVLAGHTAGTLTLVPGIYDPLTTLFRQVFSAAVNSVFRTQRRRVKGVGA